MKFIDEIHVDVPGRSALASLFVDPDADYLEDHFPGAPMLPGLVMLEAAVRAAAAIWLTREQSPVAVSMLDRLERLQVVRRVVPGETVVVNAEIIEPTENRDTQMFKATGDVTGQIVMRARFRLRSLDAERAASRSTRR